MVACFTKSEYNFYQSSRKCEEKAMKRLKKNFSYLKDFQFSRMLVKYFLILFLALVLPITCFNGLYQNLQEKNFQKKLIEKNEELLEQVYNSADAVFTSSKNILYSLVQQQDIKYLSVGDSIEDSSEKAALLADTFGIIKRANNYMDSMGVWFRKSNIVVSNLGYTSLSKYSDQGWRQLYELREKNRISYEVRKKNGIYPYLLTFLYPLEVTGENDSGAVFVNIDMERLGEHLGTGRYETKDDSSTLLILEKSNGNLVYSDEYRFWQQDNENVKEIWKFLVEKDSLNSDITILGEKEYIISVKESKEGFLYVYLSPLFAVESKVAMVDGIYQKMFLIMIVLCVILAFAFALWIYRPIRKTVNLLDSFSMLVGWDEKNGLDEIESIQRSILHLKEHNDSQNELLKERMLSLHNAQICALQTQINPHFLYNCLESIGNLTAIMMGGETKVTEAIYTLGKLMRISLSGKNYLVPLSEELEHVSIYIHLMELIEPEFRKRVHLHMDIPEEMKKERIIKLALQPIIENALEHGLSGKRREGNIWIKGTIKDNKNYLSIMDDGMGVTEEQLDSLRNSLKESAIVSNRHIGLKNVNQRLKLVFGEECGLRVEQKEYFTVTIVFDTLKKLES